MRLIGAPGLTFPDVDDSDVREMDAALIKPLPEVDVPRRVGEIWVSADIYEPIEPNAIELVYKAGAASGFTTGEIASINADFEVVNGGRVITYQGGYLVMSVSDDGPFAQRGDSGSAVVTADGRVLGMVVAKEEDPKAPNDPSALAFVLPIRPILDAMDAYLPGA